MCIRDSGDRVHQRDAGGHPQHHLRSGGYAGAVSYTHLDVYKRQSLTWRLLTAEEMTDVYLHEMRRDCPAGELKPLSMSLNSEAAGTAHTWGVYEDDALVAYLLMVRPEMCIRDRS